MKPHLPLIVILSLTLSVPAFSQETKKKRIPIAISHLPAENRPMMKRPGNSPHNFFSMVLCFKKKCRSYIGWRTRQRKMRFKGYKDGGTPPRRHEQIHQIEQDTVLAKASPLPAAKAPADVPSAALELKQLFILDEVLFELNSAQLNTRFTYRLDSLVTILTEHPHLTVSITGHTDITGDEKINRKLSQDRAKAVATYLINRSIASTRVQHNGEGSSRPIFSNDTEDGRKRNRRVEILIVGQ